MNCKSALLEMQDIVLRNGFTDEQEEIEFFKNIKPKVNGKLLYYAKVFSIKTKWPNSRNNVQRKFLLQEQDKITAFQSNNLIFYQYDRCKTNNPDDRFFLRGKADIRLCIGRLHFLVDPNFSTSHDHTVSAIKAYDMLSVYLPDEKGSNSTLKRLSEKAAFLLTFKFQIKIIRKIFLEWPPK